MRPFFLPIWVLLLANIFYISTNAQTHAVDSIFRRYETLNDREKISEAPEAVMLLNQYNAREKGHEVIALLSGVSAPKGGEKYKQGIVLLSKALLYKTDSTEQCTRYAQEAASYLEGHNIQRAEALSLLLMSYYGRGRFDSTIQVGERLLPEIRKSTNTGSELEALMCIGRSYDFLGNRKKAIEVNLKGISLAKQHHKEIKLAELYISMSTFYKGEDVQIAKRYALQSISVLRNSKHSQVSQVMNAAYLMIGNVYYDLAQTDSAMYYYELSRDASLRIGDRRTYLSAIGNIANVLYEQGNYNKALEYNLLTLAEYRKIGLNSEIAVAFGSLADIYKDMKLYRKAIPYYDSALAVTKLIGSADDYIYNYKGLSETYEMLGDYKEAFRYYKLYRMWNDSINNNQNSKKIAQLELDYKYKTEQKEKDLIQQNKDLLTQEKLSRQNYIIWTGVFGTLILVVFLIFTVRTNINRKKVNAKLQAFNEEVLRQKDIIEEKNNEITDSITYASRIQQGVIPDESEMKTLFPEHFVFFKPRDIVSGDFYWANRNARGKATLAVADCTGHGVPGAFMSLVGNTLLNQTLNHPGIDTPAQALDYINQQLPRTIKSKSSTGAIKDGMEISMCEFDQETNSLTFAGANTNIYLVRQGHIQIYRGDKQPIGDNLAGNTLNYTNHSISLCKGDCIFMITDGFADQFGGEKGKKFKYKPLEDLFCVISAKNPDEQLHQVASTFNNWKLNHEQVDDVLVIGVKV